MENINYKRVVALVFLVLTVLFSVYIYTSRSNKAEPLNEAVAENKQEAKTQSIFLGTLNQSLTEDERILLNVERKALTKEEGQIRFDLASRLAVEGKELNITNCVARPTVLKVRNGTSITVFNGGTKDISFGFDTNKIAVPIGKSAAYRVDFKLGQGLYGYGCDNKDVSRAVGLILVTP